MTSNHVLRLSAAAVLCGAVVWVLFPHATSYVSTSAVVNAPLITVRSPIDGRIEVASPAVAEPIHAGERMALVEADLHDRALVEDLVSRESQIAAQIDAVSRQIETLTSVRDDLKARDERHRARMSAWLAAKREELSANLAGAVAQRDETAERVLRSQRLAASGAVTDAALRRDEAELAGAESAVAVFEAQIETSARESEALDDGVLVQAGSQDASYSRQRLDEVDLRLADVAVERARLDAERAAVALRIAEARDALAARESFAPVATARGVVWQASGAPGAAVLAGDEVLQVLDCERRFIEVMVSERHFEAIRPGSTAHVQLRGGSGRFPATVSAVRGSGAKFDHPQLAAGTPSAAEGQLRVLVELDAADGDGDSATDRHFCDVGRTAEVRFGRDLPAGLGGVGALISGWFGGADDDAPQRIDLAAAP